LPPITGNRGRVQPAALYDIFRPKQTDNGLGVRNLTLTHQIHRRPDMGWYHFNGFIFVGLTGMRL
jgi:hypothetical protein